MLLLTGVTDNAGCSKKKVFWKYSWRSTQVAEEVPLLRV